MCQHMRFLPIKQAGADSGFLERGFIYIKVFGCVGGMGVVLLILYNIWATIYVRFWYHRSQKTKLLPVKLQIFSFSLISTCVLGAQKNCLNETVLLSTTTYVLVVK